MHTRPPTHTDLRDGQVAEAHAGLQAGRLGVLALQQERGRLLAELARLPHRGWWAWAWGGLIGNGLPHSSRVSARTATAPSRQQHTANKPLVHSLAWPAGAGISVGLHACTLAHAGTQSHGTLHAHIPLAQPLFIAAAPGAVWAAAASWVCTGQPAPRPPLCCHAAAAAWGAPPQRTRRPQLAGPCCPRGGAWGWLMEPSTRPAGRVGCGLLMLGWARCCRVELSRG